MLTFPSIVKLTVTGLRISAVDTVAFLDNCADLIPYAGSGRRIRIKDAAGKYLDGVIGAKGTGETLDAELLSSISNYSYNTTFTVEGTAITQAVSISVYGYSYSNTFSLAINGLYKYSGSLNRTSGEYPKVAVFQNPDHIGNRQYFGGTLSNGANSRYLTIERPLMVRFGTESYSSTDFSLTNSLKKVLTPSTSGLLIRNLAGAQSFQSQESGFTHNAASYDVEVFDMMRVARPIRYMGSSVHHT